jgi:hypothetical protein
VREGAPAFQRFRDKQPLFHLKTPWGAKTPRFMVNELYNLYHKIS